MERVGSKNKPEKSLTDFSEILRILQTGNTRCITHTLAHTHARTQARTNTHHTKFLTIFRRNVQTIVFYKLFHELVCVCVRERDRERESESE